MSHKMCLSENGYKTPKSKNLKPQVIWIYMLYDIEVHSAVDICIFSLGRETEI